MLFRRFLLFFTAMMLTSLPAHLRQQFLPEPLVAETPPSSHRFPLAWLFLLSSPLLHHLSELFTPCWTVFGDMHFPKQPVNPKPGPSFPRRFQIFNVTAPDIIPQWLFGVQ